MSGREIFKFAVTKMVETSRSVLAEANLTTADVTWMIPHQANLRIIEAAAKRLDIGRERIIVNIEKYGNTSSASIPIALSESIEPQRLARRGSHPVHRVRRRPFVGFDRVALGGLSVRVAVVFPGQGSQAVGMGGALAESSPIAAACSFAEPSASSATICSRSCGTGQRRSCARRTSVSPRSS